MKAQLEIITPGIAKSMLETNTRNRPLSEHTVQRYVDDMLAGRWKQNGQTIVVAHNGDLLDGQHRLNAVVRSGEALSFLVARNVEPSAFDTIDNGKTRSVSDVLAIQGMKNATAQAAAARIAYIYATGSSLTLSPSRVVITDFAVKHPYLSEAASLVKSRKHRFPTGPLAAVLFLANEGRQLDEEAAEFVEGIATGANLARGDARLTLREWEIAERMRARNALSTRASFGAAARAWNAYASGKSLTVIKSIHAPTRGTLDIFGFQPGLYPEVPDLTARKASEVTRVKGRFAPAEIGAAA